MIEETDVSNTLAVYKNRTNIVQVSLGFDCSLETITSQIRSEPEQAAPLIVEWDVEFETDGTDGNLILTLTDTAVADIPYRRGWMDMLRMPGSLPVFADPIEVEFRGTVTV